MPWSGQTTLVTGHTRYICDTCDRNWGNSTRAVMCCAFACADCGERFMYQEDADVCCHPRCEYCEATHETEEDAQACCQYQCSGCGARYHYQDEALACCANYECGECGALHQSSEQADECCSGPSRYPEHILAGTSHYLLHVPEIPDRPARLTSIEQELCSGRNAIARMLYDMNLSDYNQMQNYGRDARPGRMLVKHDGSLPPTGGEVIYSRVDLSASHAIRNVSRAVAGIRALKQEGLVTTTTAAGTHIHIGALDVDGGNVFGPAQMAALYEMFSFSEEVLFHIASAGWDYHRGQGYSAILPKYAKGNVSPGKIAISARNNRYFGLNFARLMQAAQSCGCGACLAGDWEACECGTLQNGTIEWRIFNATTKPETLHAWLLLSHGMTAAAFKHEVGSLEPNGFGQTEAERHPWLLGWLLDVCVLADPERQVIIDCAKRSRTLQIDWADFDNSHEPYGEMSPPEEEDVQPRRAAPMDDHLTNDFVVMDPLDADDFFSEMGADEMMEAPIEMQIPSEEVAY